MPVLCLITFEGSTGNSMNCHPGHLLLGFSCSWSFSAGWSGILSKIPEEIQKRLTYVVGDYDTLVVVNELLIVGDCIVATFTVTIV